MGVYYHLLNDTKKHKCHWDYHIKRGPMEANPQVHASLVNYMLNNLGDTMRLVSDVMGDWDDYTEIDLSKPQNSAGAITDSLLVR